LIGAKLDFFLKLLITIDLIYIELYT
jgi:hypothetical protein